MSTLSPVTNSADDADGIPVGSKVLEAFVLCVMISISLVGNTSLWIIVLRSRALRTITNMFILGLSTADIMVATVNMPITVYTIIKGDWMFSDGVCVAFGFINMLTLVTSVLSLCNISINRFFMVCRPAKFMDIYTNRNAILMIIGTVIAAALLSSPPLLGWSQYVYTPTHSFCFADWVNNMTYAYAMIGCCFGIPFSVMTFCNICIISSVRRSSRKVKSSCKPAVSSTMYCKNDVTGIPEDNVHNSKLVENNGTVIQLSKIVKDNNDMQSVTMKSKPSPEPESEPSSKTNPARDHIKIDGVVRHSSNTDVLSYDSSNESDSALQSNIQSTNRNQVFDVPNPNRDTHKKLLHVESPYGIQQTSNTIDNNVLNPRWNAKSKTEGQRGTSVSVDSKTEGSVNITHSNSLVTSKHPVKMRSNGKDNMRRREEIRLAVSLIVVVLLFVICWLPYCVSMLISIHHHGYIPRQFHMFTLLIGYANSGCNPIIYGIMNKRFKLEYKKLFCFWKAHVFTLGTSS